MAATSRAVRGRGFVSFSILAAFFLGLYFLIRMKQFGAEVNDLLPDEYLQRTRLFPGEWNLRLGALGVTVLTLVALFLVWWN